MEMYSIIPTDVVGYGGNRGFNAIEGRVDTDITEWFWCSMYETPVSINSALTGKVTGAKQQEGDSNPYILFGIAFFVSQANAGRGLMVFTSTATLDIARRVNAGWQFMFYAEYAVPLASSDKYYVDANRTLQIKIHTPGGVDTSVNFYLSFTPNSSATIVMDAYKGNAPDNRYFTATTYHKGFGLTSFFDTTMINQLVADAATDVTSASILADDGFREQVEDLTRSYAKEYTASLDNLYASI